MLIFGGSRQISKINTSYSISVGGWVISCPKLSPNCLDCFSEAYKYNLWPVSQPTRVLKIKLKVVKCKHLKFEGFLSWQHYKCCLILNIHFLRMMMNASFWIIIRNKTIRSLNYEGKRKGFMNKLNKKLFLNLKLLGQAW